jgi:energy-coupling factor transport system ATP-binding protein
VTFTYPHAGGAALSGVSLRVEPGELVAVLGGSGSGKSTLLRALAGLVPHFHGGRFAGRVEVGGHDTRSCGPAALAGVVATVFQDPEDQVVMTRVENEIAFGLENLGTPPGLMRAEVARALDAVGAAHLLERRVAELSEGEVQRIALASALALEPRLLLLDEPTSQLDPGGAEALMELACRLARERETAVLVTEQRPALPLELCDRVVFLVAGRIALDAPRDEALDWLREHAPAWCADPPPAAPSPAATERVVGLAGVSFAYSGRPPVLENVSVDVHRGEVLALTGPNASGKTTLAKVAAGLLEPQGGSVARRGRACYLPQDAGRYLVAERVRDEVRSAEARAAVGLHECDDRHPLDLSSGERERLALAAVLEPASDLLVLDEPTRGVDPAGKRDLARLLRAQAARRATLLVTHDLAFAATAADRVVALGRTREAALA